MYQTTGIKDILHINANETQIWYGRFIWYILKARNTTHTIQFSEIKHIFIDLSTPNLMIDINLNLFSNLPINMTVYQHKSDKKVVTWNFSGLFDKNKIKSCVFEYQRNYMGSGMILGHLKKEIILLLINFYHSQYYNSNQGYLIYVL